MNQFIGFLGILPLFLLVGSACKSANVSCLVGASFITVNRSSIDICAMNSILPLVRVRS